MLPPEAKCLLYVHIFLSWVWSNIAYLSSCQPWPVSLAVQVGGQDKSKKYTPQSDFSLWINDFPHLVWELCLDPCTHTDDLCMWACVTSIAKLGNRIFEARSQQLCLWVNSHHWTIQWIWGWQIHIRFINTRMSHLIWLPCMIALNLPSNLTNLWRSSKVTIETHSISILSSKGLQLMLWPMSSTAFCSAENLRNANRTQGPRAKVVVDQEGLGSLFKGTSSYQTMLSTMVRTSSNHCARYEQCYWWDYSPTEKSIFCLAVTTTHTSDASSPRHQWEFLHRKRMSPGIAWGKTVGVLANA